MFVAQETIMSEYEVNKFLKQRFFRCRGKFLSWLKVGESYWFEYLGNEKFGIRSDNEKGRTFEMTIHQLLTCFYPVECENNLKTALKYFHWLGERGIHRGYVEDLADYIVERNTKTEPLNSSNDDVRCKDMCEIFFEE